MKKLWSIAVVAAWLVGCGTTPGELNEGCTTDDECSLAETCVDGRCEVGTCTGTSDCIGGGDCADDGICAYAGCELDSQCALSELCSGGLCVAESAAECLADGACEPDERCQGGRCVESGTDDECDDNGDCFRDGSQEICVAGACVAPPEDDCDNDTDCDSGQRCAGGTCVPDSPDRECVDDFDCGLNEACVGGRCEFRVPAECGLDQDCGPDLICFEGVCASGVACRPTGTCPDGELCVEGMCVPAVFGCDNDRDCDDDETCDFSSGRCTPREPQPGCADGQDCPPGTFCDPELDACLEIPPGEPCMLNEECGGYSCNVDMESCNTLCTTRIPCGPFFVCDAERQCVPEDMGFEWTYIAIISATTNEPDLFETTTPGPDIDAIELARATGEIHYATQLEAVRQGDSGENNFTTMRILGPNDAIPAVGADCNLDSADQEFWSMGDPSGFAVVSFPRNREPLRTGDIVAVWELNDETCANVGVARLDAYEVYIGRSTVDITSITRASDIGGDGWLSLGASPETGGYERFPVVLP